MEFHSEETITLCPYAAIVTVPPQYVHAASFAKIVFIEKGERTLEINDNTGKVIKSYHLKEGDAFIIKAYQPHTYKLEKSKKYVHRDIYLPNDMLKELCDNLKPGLYDELCNNYSKPFRLSPPTFIYFIERSSFLLGKEKNSLKDIIRKTIALDILGHYITTNDEQVARPVWINTLIRNIDDESFITLSIKDMVSSTNYSHGYVNREFKKYMNCSLKHFVNNRKLELASVMLATSDISLLEIVIRLSFTTTSSFITLFKEKFGITPGQYRKSQSTYISLDEYTPWGSASER